MSDIPFQAEGACVPVNPLKDSDMNQFFTIRNQNGEVVLARVASRIDDMNQTFGVMKDGKEIRCIVVGEFEF